MTPALPSQQSVNQKTILTLFNRYFQFQIENNSSLFAPSFSAVQHIRRNCTLDSECWDFSSFAFKHNIWRICWFSLQSLITNYKYLKLCVPIRGIDGLRLRFCRSTCLKLIAFKLLDKSWLYRKFITTVKYWANEWRAPQTEQKHICVSIIWMRIWRFTFDITCIRYRLETIYANA